MYFTSFKSMLRVKNASKSLGNTTLVLPMLYLGPFGNLPPKNHLKPPKIALFGPKFMYFTGLMSMSRVKNARQSLGNSTLVLLMLYLGRFGNTFPKNHQKPPKIAPFQPIFVYFTGLMSTFWVNKYHGVHKMRQPRRHSLYHC